MVSRDFQTLAARRAKRALTLAERYPASGEALRFFAAIASFQGEFAASLPPRADPGRPLDALLPGRAPLVALIEAKGTDRLRDEAKYYDEVVCLESLRAYLARDDVQSPRSFFARVLLQAGMSVAGFSDAITDRPPGPNIPGAACPRCSHPPQLGILRKQGDGSALVLVCSLCLHEWPFTRLRCPACGGSDHHKISFYSTSEFAHLEVQVCEACNAYLKLVQLEKDLHAVADADELAALPLDVWAKEKGYWKVQPNLAGI